MSFLHSGLLWVLPLALIPIALHLLTLHRIKTVDLSTFRFLFDSYVQQRRRMKFLEALIAMLRTAFVLFLIFSIARPVVQHWDSLLGGGGGGRDIVLMIDGSASMAAATQGVTSMARARQAATKIVENLSKDDRVTIIRVGARPEEICSRFSGDAKALTAEIDQLKSGSSRGNLFAALTDVFGEGARELNNPRVYLLTDLQASDWKELKDGVADNLVPAETEVVVVNIGSNQTIPNRAVIGSKPEKSRVLVGLPIHLRPRVVNHAKLTADNAATAEKVEVVVLLNEKEIARKSLSLKPGETKETEIIYRPTEPGPLRGRFEISADRFTHDDRFRFSMEVVPRIKILLVNGNPSAKPLENEGLYLRTAMYSTAAQSDAVEESETAVPASTPAVPSPQQELLQALDVVDLPEANLNAETLRDAAAVILANCGALNAAQFSLLSDFVADGGGLLIFPGDKVNPDTYNKQLFVGPTLPEEKLMSAELGAIVGDPDKAETFQRFGAVDLAHPIFSVFANADQPYMTRINVYRRFPLTLAESDGNAWPTVEFSDGSPALLESRFGTGRVLVSAFPLNTRWSNLPMTPEFVPLVLRMISHVRRPDDLDSPAVVAAGGTAEFTVAPTWAPANGKVTDIRGRVTPVSFQRSNSQLKGAFHETTTTGYYTMEVTGGRTEDPKQGTVSFAVNLSEEESNFSGLQPDQIKRMLPSADVTTIDASAEALQKHGNIGNQREIWRPLILLILAIIGVEFLLSTLGGQHVDGEEPPTTAARIRHLASGRWVGRMTGAGVEEIAAETVE